MVNRKHGFPMSGERRLAMRVKEGSKRLYISLRVIVALILLASLAACGSSNNASTAPTAQGGAAGATAAPAAGAPATTAAPQAGTGGQANATPGAIQISVVKGTMIDTMRKLAEK